jgi:hypothetical protein
MIVKAGPRLPKHLQKILGDQVLIQLWNEGTESRRVRKITEPESCTSITHGSV